MCTSRKSRTRALSAQDAESVTTVWVKHSLFAIGVAVLFFWLQTFYAASTSGEGSGFRGNDWWIDGRESSKSLFEDAELRVSKVFTKMDDQVNRASVISSNLSTPIRTHDDRQEFNRHDSVVWAVWHAFASSINSGSMSIPSLTKLRERISKF